MCVLCDQGAAPALRDCERERWLGLYGLSIAPAELLDNGSVGVTRRVTATDGVLDYYLHTPGGAVWYLAADSGSREIQSISIPDLIKTISMQWCVA